TAWLSLFTSNEPAVRDFNAVAGSDKILLEDFYKGTIARLKEENHFFIMHSEGDSVKFQCYKDTNYFLHVNDDSLDIRVLDHEDCDGDRNFVFKVTYF
ncbi:UNVERIFIED_CONTAM: hypothetical protein H355_010530, partial [Colinus virginianus]